MVLIIITDPSFEKSNTRSLFWRKIYSLLPNEVEEWHWYNWKFGFRHFKLDMYVILYFGTIFFWELCRLEDAGYAVGARVLELLCHRDKVTFNYRFPSLILVENFIDEDSCFLVFLILSFSIHLLQWRNWMAWNNEISSLHCFFTYHCYMIFIFYLSFDMSLWLFYRHLSYFMELQKSWIYFLLFIYSFFCHRETEGRQDCWVFCPLYTALFGRSYLERWAVAIFIS